MVPVKAILLTWAIMAVLGCIYIGSSTAFNALVGCNVLLANISFAFPIGLLLLGRRKYMIKSAFPLGNILGPIINSVALAWIVFMVIFFNFPFSYPVAADNMSALLPWLSWPQSGLTPCFLLDYSSVIIGAVIIFSGAYWMIRGHKTYTGPVSL